MILAFFDFVDPKGDQPWARLVDVSSVCFTGADTMPMSRCTSAARPKLKHTYGLACCPARGYPIQSPHDRGRRDSRLTMRNISKISLLLMALLILAGACGSASKDNGLPANSAGTPSGAQGASPEGANEPIP